MITDLILKDKNIVEGGDLNIRLIMIMIKLYKKMKMIKFQNIILIFTLNFVWKNGIPSAILDG